MDQQARVNAYQHPVWQYRATDRLPYRSPVIDARLFRDLSDGRKWRVRCEQKRRVWMAFLEIGHGQKKVVATASQISRLKHMPLRTVEWIINLLRGQGFFQNVRRLGFNGSIERELVFDRLRILRPGSNEPCAESCGVNAFKKLHLRESQPQREPQPLPYRYNYDTGYEIGCKERVEKGKGLVKEGSTSMCTSASLPTSTSESGFKSKSRECGARFSPGLGESEREGFESEESEKGVQNAYRPDLTLKSVLDIEEKYFKTSRDRKGFQWLCVQWCEAGCPVECKLLEKFLDSKLSAMARDGIRYPRVALLRLKELQRGEFSPLVPQIYWNYEISKPRECTRMSEADFEKEMEMARAAQLKIDAMRADTRRERMKQV